MSTSDGDIKLIHNSLRWLPGWLVCCWLYEYGSDVMNTISAYVPVTSHPVLPGIVALSESESAHANLTHNCRGKYTKITLYTVVGMSLLLLLIIPQLLTATTMNSPYD